jgi:hypothetical protein
MFANTARRAAALTIAMTALTALAACDATPSGPRSDALARPSAFAAPGSVAASATPVRQGATVPFNFVQYASCANGGAGEVLGAVGQLTWQGTQVLSAGERNHVAFISRFTGTAIGEESGETYDVQSRELYQGSLAYGDDGILDSGQQLQRIQLRFTSRATGMVIDIVLDVHFVETPTGQYVLDGWNGTARCR